MTEMMGSVVADDDVRLAYKVVGEGSHNLRLMHGWGGFANSWNGFNQWLGPRKFRAIAFDIRGRGNSEKITTGFTDERCPKDELAVADVVGATKFLPVGFSMSRRFVQYARMVTIGLNRPSSLGDCLLVVAELEICCGGSAHPCI
jgi:pimeloyl-ACP methyl ester carboxylesterase